MRKASSLIVFSLFLLLLSMGNLAMTSVPVQAAVPAYDITPVPPPTPPPSEPPDGGTSVITSISQIFHHLVFPAETIS